MRVGVGVVLSLVLGCASTQVVSTARFVATDTSAPSETAPVTDKAITVRGIDGVLAANGRYLGNVWVKAAGDHARVDAVREATLVAAAAGGTHIVLKNAEVTRETTTHFVPPAKDEGREVRSERNPSAWRGTAADAEVRAVFVVYRLDPEYWEQLHPSMRPRPISRR